MEEEKDRRDFRTRFWHSDLLANSTLDDQFACFRTLISRWIESRPIFLEFDLLRVNLNLLRC